MGSKGNPGNGGDDIGDSSPKNSKRIEIIEIPRKTYIKGKLTGKYWGELDFRSENKFVQEKFFDFNIYEAEVSSPKFRSVPFILESTSRFPRERLPEVMPIIIRSDATAFGVNLHDPLLANVSFDQKLHQTDENEVFGTIEAEISGYLLDFIKQEIEIDDTILEETVIEEQTKIHGLSENIQTGKVETIGDYQRTQYYNRPKKTTDWGDWRHKPTVKSEGLGCLSMSYSILGIILGISFILFLLPSFLYAVPIILFFVLFRYIQPLLSYVFGALGFILIILFLVAMVSWFLHDHKPIRYTPVVQDEQTERRSEEVYVDSINHQLVDDTLIVHYRRWSDYSGKSYEGKFWVKKREFNASRNFKSNLTIAQSSSNDYDHLLGLIKQNENGGLNGLYLMFDSIRKSNNLSPKDFTEVIVCFVQDIPYTLVVPGACDPNLYTEQFIREYLASANAKCDGYEKFGINTPIEFIATLKGDCDTRTLLLFTVLDHYGYDAAVLSSEYYNHSILGINLSYDGIGYNFRNQRYTLWETTAPGHKPGLLPREISNLQYWRISLKSR
jgi:hypothetical protein